MAVTTIAKVPLVVLQQYEDEGCFQYGSSNLNYVDESSQRRPVYVSIRASRHSAVESHFERVVAEEELHTIDKLRKEFQRGPELEQATKTEEDARSLHVRESTKVESRTMHRDQSLGPHDVEKDAGKEPQDGPNDAVSQSSIGGTTARRKTMLLENDARDIHTSSEV